MEIISQLSQIPLFSKGFSQEELLNIEDQARLIRVPAMYNLYKNDNDLDSVFIVLRGSVMIYDLKGTVRRVYTVIQKGDLFGESAIIGARRYSLSADTREESDIFVFPRNVFLQLLRDKPELNQRMKEMIVERLQAQKDIIDAEMERARKFDVAEPVHGVKQIA